MTVKTQNARSMYVSPVSALTWWDLFIDATSDSADAEWSLLSKNYLPTTFIPRSYRPKLKNAAAVTAHPQVKARISRLLAQIQPARHWDHDATQTCSNPECGFQGHAGTFFSCRPYTVRLPLEQARGLVAYQRQFCTARVLAGPNAPHIISVDDDGIATTRARDAQSNCTKCRTEAARRSKLAKVKARKRAAKAKAEREAKAVR